MCYSGGMAAVFTKASCELSENEIQERYGGLLREAASAFATDPSYLADVAERASLIAYKRKIWAIRMEVSRAEREARDKCVRAIDFVCTNISPCGFGDCRFAAPEDADISVVSTEPDRERPRTAMHPKYRLADALAEKLLQNKITPPPRLTGGAKRRL